MDIQKKALKLAISLFNPNLDKEQHHFSFLFDKNKLISVGFNDYNLSAKALKFAELFNVEQKKNYPYLHSEIHSISRVWGKVYIDKRIRLVNVRIIRSGQIGLAKPCPDCAQVLNALGLTKIWWTKFGGDFTNKETI